MVLFVFFKKKTAYEMRISDWSSDVCSSDLLRQSLHDALFLKRVKQEVEGHRTDAEAGATSGEGSCRENTIEEGIAGGDDEVRVGDLGVETELLHQPPLHLGEAHGQHDLLAAGHRHQVRHLDRKSTRLNSSH